MSALELLVLAGSAAAILFVLWYFFWSRGEGVRADSGAGVQQARIRVKGAYDPDTIVVEAGRPVRLEFYRDETNACSEVLALPSFGIHRELPAFATTSIEFTPAEPGEYEFTCGMNMMRGRIVVEPASRNPVREFIPPPRSA
jgi:plastocyanin domain-containing protein